MSFADMLTMDPNSLDTTAGRDTTPTRERLRREKSALKAHAKALKEEEKARKEAEKLAKLKLAVQARNDKIDAHDRAVREKAAQKLALKQAKEQAATESWRLQARQDSERVWGVRSSETLLAKAHALQV